MSDEPALLAAILAHPDEDTPRLIYADWLDEHGRAERAEFVRIQCAPEADDAAEERAAELEDRNRVKWLMGLGLPQFPGANWAFRRGFPEHLDVPAELFLERYGAFARVPWLRSLLLHELDNAIVRDFVNRPWPPQWIELELQEGFAASDNPGYDSTPSVVAIAACPQVRRLRRLLLSLSPFRADGWRALDPLLKEFGDRLVIG